MNGEEPLIPNHVNSLYRSISRTASGVMVSVLTSSVVDSRFEPLSYQTKDCRIGIFASPLSKQH